MREDKLSIVPAMKTRPPLVATGPPRVGTPSGSGRPRGALSRVVPSERRQITWLVERSTAASSPHGGALQGMPSGDKNAPNSTENGDVEFGRASDLHHAAPIAGSPFLRAAA